MIPDLLVLGGGPAGRLLAAAAAARGLRVACVDPAPDAPWPNRYGLWVDEAGPLADCMAHQWSAARMRPAGDAVVWPRAYGTLDDAAVRARLAVDCIEGRAEAVTHDATGTTVTLADGCTLRGAVVVDATGRGLGASAPAAGFQVAYGQLVEVEGHDEALDTMGLMDFQAVPAAAPAPPTFLYTMPFGPTRLFVEETVLAERRPSSFEALAARLEARLAHQGWRVLAVHAEERCLIPMGTPLPAPDRLLPFGAAAGLVHPATGYSLAHSLRAAPVVADALAEGLGRGDPAAAVRAAWAALWPREKQRLWTVYRFGLQILTRLDLPETQAFFSAFFALPAPLAQGWLAGTLTVAEAREAMWGVFGGLPAGLRARLIAHGLRPHGWRLLGALLG
ncbi:MAG: lycopene cyclase family protein [bacterium]